VACRSQWDDDTLYLGCDVNDDVLVADSDPTTPWKDDSLELVFDGLHDQQDFGSDDHKYEIRLDGNVTDFAQPLSSPISAAVIQRTGGYVIEVAIPRSNFHAGAFLAGKVLGFNIGLTDDDDGGGKEGQLVWMGATTYGASGDFGDLVLEERPTATSTPTPTSTPTATATPTDTPTLTLTPTATPSTGSITGVVWYDEDGDGMVDEGEPPLPDVEVTLSTVVGVAIETQLTTADGSYGFTDLEPGTYMVTETDPEDYSSTTPNQVVVAVVAGSTVEINFGDMPTVPPTDTPTPVATDTPTPTPTPASRCWLPLILRE